MIIDISTPRSLLAVKGIALTVATTLMLFASSGAYAVKFSFDPSSGMPLMAANYVLPTAIVAIVSFLAVIIIAFERKKARGVWFSTSEKLR